MVLCGGLNIRIKDFYCVHNFVLVCTFNVIVSETNVTKQHIYSYNPTLTTYIT